MAAASGLSQMEKGDEKIKSIGIDIGKRRCIVCIMGRNGAVLEETGHENTYAAATAFARKAEGVREMPSGVRVDGKSLDQDVRGV